MQNPSKIPTYAEEPVFEPSSKEEALALNAVQQFIQAPQNGTTIRTLAANGCVGGIQAAQIEPTGDRLPVIAFNMRDSAGDIHRCQCSPAAFGLLMVIFLLGESIFIDRSEKGGRPYLKVCGRMSKSAGISFGRIVAGADEGEDVIFGNGNSLDFHHTNLLGRRGNKRTKRSTLEVYAELLTARSRSELFPGSPVESFEQRKELLHRALACLDEERALATDQC